MLAAKRCVNYGKESVYAVVVMGRSEAVSEVGRGGFGGTPQRAGQGKRSALHGCEENKCKKVKKLPFFALTLVVNCVYTRAAMDVLGFLVLQSLY